MIIKTKDANFKKIEEFIKKNHSYEIPEIVAVDVKSVSEPYWNWLLEELA